jgi:hypothetical protein
MASWSGWASREIVGICPPLVLSNPFIRCGFGGKAQDRMTIINAGYLDAQTCSVNFGFRRVRGHSGNMASCLPNTPFTAWAAGSYGNLPGNDDSERWAKRWPNSAIFALRRHVRLLDAKTRFETRTVLDPDQ